MGSSSARLLALGHLRRIVAARAARASRSIRIPRPVGRATALDAPSARLLRALRARGLLAIGLREALVQLVREAVAAGAGVAALRLLVVAAHGAHAPIARR